MDSSSEEEEACLFAMQLTSACVLPMALKTAIELDLLELIKKAGPAGSFVSPAQLAAQIPTCTNREAPVVLDRILFLLSTYSVLNCSLKTLPDGGVERLYSLARVCKFLTKNKDGVSLSPLLLFNLDKIPMESWYHLKDAVLDGGVAFEKARGATDFEYIGTDPIFNKLFNLGMSSQSTIVMKKIVEIYDGFVGLESIVDVGGGTGASINMIISKYPLIKGINFDLPHVIEDAPAYPGVEHVGGDMFVGVPKGDAIFIKCVLHDWGDEYCLKILKRCYDALPEKGKVVMAENLLPESPNTDMATKLVVNIDMTMLAQTQGGKERTEKEFEALAKGVGFKKFAKVCRAYNLWIMELHK